MLVNPEYVVIWRKNSLQWVNYMWNTRISSGKYQCGKTHLGFILAKTKQVIHSYYAVAEFGPKKVQTNFQSGNMFSHYINLYNGFGIVFTV